MTDTQPALTTTDAGIPIESDEHSLTVGPDGPILLHDQDSIADDAAKWWVTTNGFSDAEATV